MNNSKYVLFAENLNVRYRLKKGNLTVRAVDGVTLGVGQRGAIGVVGESGSGKTTLGRAFVRLVKPHSGHVYYNGKDIWCANKDVISELRRNVQMVFQDPLDSIDPLYTVREAVAEGIKALKIASTKHELEELVMRSLEMVRLVPADSFAEKKITSLSGGQRQRVAIARTLAINPKTIILDEPVSMLDASIRGEIISILNSLKANGTSFMMITHDIATLRFFADVVAVMYLGKVVELGPTPEVVMKPLHPYTQALIAAVPVPDRKRKVRGLAKGEIPSAINIPSGCRFHTRCPLATDICSRVEPELRNVVGERFVACHKV